MSLYELFLALIGCGVILWVVEKAPFISQSMKPLITWLVLAFVVIWFCNALGLFAWLKSARL